MTTPNRTAIISKLYKVLKKHYKPIAPPADRTALEHLLYGCLLENSRYEAADEAGDRPPMDLGPRHQASSGGDARSAPARKSSPFRDSKLAVSV
jgi:hypothetical protein